MNECKIVEDLLPLYAEDLTNEESSEFVRKHVESCERCNELLQRCHEAIPSGEVDAKAYKKALRKNQLNLLCKGLLAFFVVIGVLAFACEKLEDYCLWKEGKAPVEQIVEAPVGNGKVTLVDWDASGWQIGDAKKQGTVIWVKTMDVREDEYGVGWNMSEGSYNEPWENVQVYWSPDATAFLTIADLLEGGEGIYVHSHKSWYDEDGRHYGETKFLPSAMGNGFQDVLTALCKEHEAFPTGWETIKFSFHQWQDDSETITFVYETDNGYRGLLDFHYPTETITKLN